MPRDRGRGGQGEVPVDVRDVCIPPIGLEGVLRIPRPAQAIIVFAHGSGSSRLSPRNTAVAESLNSRGMATLLFDLLTADEDRDRGNVFNIPLLAGRLADAVRWLDAHGPCGGLPLGLFGASTGAAAALVAAAELGSRVGAVVSRGGRPDLAGAALERVAAPTLLIVGSADTAVMVLNRHALARLPQRKVLQTVPGATHLFPEPGAMEAVIEHAAHWFELHLGAGEARNAGTERQ